MINRTKSYVEQTVPGSTVIYGDTDSVMIRFPRDWTRERVFQVAKRLADEVTALFPKEVKLDFEKVWHPYILLKKKNYAGLKFEKVDDKPKYVCFVSLVCVQEKQK